MELRTDINRQLLAMFYSCDQIFIKFLRSFAKAHDDMQRKLILTIGNQLDIRDRVILTLHYSGKDISDIIAEMNKLERRLYDQDFARKQADAEKKGVTFVPPVVPQSYATSDNIASRLQRAIDNFDALLKEIATHE